MAEPWRVQERRVWRPLAQRISAPQLLVLSFVGLIALGTVGFAALPGLGEGGPVGWVDALFTATSAVCVTGLTVFDVSQRLTFRGELWLLVLIQAGGLGILTFASWIATLAGRRSTLAVEEATGGGGSTLRASDPIRLVRITVSVTLALEATGALALWVAWRDRFGGLEGVWLAVFHAVSAFCNAGFSLFSDSLVGARDDAGVLAIVGGLVVVGGLGFPVLQDLRYRLTGRHRRLALHTRLVLAMTGLLLAGGAVLYHAFEADQSLESLGALDRMSNALFMSVTARTAGFNTVDYDQITNPALFLTLVLMWIGGAPASTAGGVKVTTAAILGLVLWSRLRGEGRVSVAGRSLPQETVARSTGLAVGAVLLLGVFLFALLTLELPVEGERVDRLHLIRLLFELQSAFGTVGLSMGVTPTLTPAGRLLLVPVMVLGRIGPLVILAAMAARQRRRMAFRYAHEDVLVG